jgi:hypothetical protein
MKKGPPLAAQFKEESAPPVDDGALTAEQVMRRGAVILVTVQARHPLSFSASQRL